MVEVCQFFITVFVSFWMPKSLLDYETGMNFKGTKFIINDGLCCYALYGALNFELSMICSFLAGGRGYTPRFPQGTFSDDMAQS